LIPLIRAEDDLQRPDAVIVHALPLDCRPVLRELAGRPEFANAMQARLIAYTTLEFAGEIPADMAADMDGDFDQWWFPCERNVGSVGDRLPAQLVPHAFDDIARACADADLQRSTNETFTFYYVGAWNNRKNPEGLIRAYTRAFSRKDPVRLILRCHEASLEQFVLAVAATGIPQSDQPVMMFRPDRATDAELVELHRRADCFVTASRGEAWNFGAFDAMAARRHIITTDHLGSEEFLYGSSATRVVSRLAPAGADATLTAPNQNATAVPVRVFRTHGYTTRSLWREPDLLALSGAMRMVYDNRVRHLYGGFDLSDVYSYESVGELARKLLGSECSPR